MSYCEFGRSNRSNQLILLTKPTGFVNGPTVGFVNGLFTPVGVNVCPKCRVGRTSFHPTHRARD